MSNAPWFRLYSADLLNSRKLHHIARRLNRPLTQVTGVWVMLLALANESSHRGRLLLSTTEKLSVDDISSALSLSPRLTKIFLDAFCELKMIDENGAIVGWENCQFDSDLSTNRVRRHREMKRFGNVSETFQERSGETPVQRFGNGTEQNRTEGDDRYIYYRHHPHEHDCSSTARAREDDSDSDIHRRIIKVWEAVMRRPLTRYDLQWIDAWIDDVGADEVLEVFKICQHEQPANPRSYANAVFKNRAENPPPHEIDERAALDAEMDARGIPAHPPWETDPNWRPPEWTPEATNA